MILTAKTFEMLGGLENRLKGKEVFKYHCTFTNISTRKKNSTTGQIYARTIIELCRILRTARMMLPNKTNKNRRYFAYQELSKT